MADAGYDVVGVDVDAEQVEGPRDGEPPVNDVSDEQVAGAVGNGVTFTTDYDARTDIDFVSTLRPVPTPRAPYNPVTSIPRTSLTPS